MKISLTSYHWFFLAGLAFVLFHLIYKTLRVLSDKRDRIYAEPLGDANKASLYSLTFGMSPFKKETAYLHWPTYIAGIGFHASTFLGFAWLILHLIQVTLPQWINYTSIAIFVLGALFGAGILVKRLVQKKMRMVSNPDDYFSNLLISGFQILSALALLQNSMQNILFIWSGVMMFYIPFGKLQHALYFIPTRIQLGRYFGQRGTWPKARRVM